MTNLTQIQIRRDTAENWSIANPTLLSGEIGYETDTKKLKIGDGTSDYNTLSYFAGTIEGAGDIISHNVSEFATAAQGTKADNALPNTTKYGADLSYENHKLQLKDQEGNLIGNEVTIESAGKPSITDFAEGDNITLAEAEGKIKISAATGLKADNIKEGNNIRITQDGNDITISATGEAGGGTWGSITGNIEDQADLKEILDKKQEVLVAGENITIERTTPQEVLVPEEYQQVTYLKGDATAYINLGFPANSNYTFNLKLKGAGESKPCWFGATETSGAMYSVANSSSTMYCNTFQTSITTLGSHSTVAEFDITITKTENIKVYQNDVLLFDKAGSGIIKTDAAQPLYIFARNAKGTPERISAMTLYSLKCYNGEELFRQYIPCYRKEDNVAGLYETETQTFLTNANSSGQFTVGEDVYPAEEQLVISATGGDIHDSTITITQGGVTKGSFTLNQSTDKTIALDKGGEWGSIEGNIENQQDLSLKFDSKQDKLKAGDNITIEHEAGPGGLLPEEYQQVEFLKSSGKQFIDLGVVAKDTLSYEIDFELLPLETTVSTGPIMFGTNSSTGIYSIAFKGLGTTGITYYCNTFESTVRILDSSFTTNTRVYHKVTKTSNILVKKADGTILYDVSGSGLTNKTDTLNLTIFGRRNSTTVVERLATARLYGFKMDDNGTELFNLVPCYRKVDNKPGLYNLTNDSFLTNSGTSDDFTVGPDVIIKGDLIISAKKLNLVEGPNITLIKSGDDVTISATGELSPTVQWGTITGDINAQVDVKGLIDATKVTAGENVTIDENGVLSVNSKDLITGTLNYNSVSHTDNNPEIGLISYSDGTILPPASSASERYVSDYIEVTGDFMVIHGVIAPGTASYACYALYDDEKNFVLATNRESFNISSTTMTPVGDIRLIKDDTFKYVRFCTANTTDLPTYDVCTEDTGTTRVTDILTKYDFSNLSYGSGVQTLSSIGAIGLIGYPDGSDKSVASGAPNRYRSDYIEITGNGIKILNVYAPGGVMYSAYALYDANKKLVKAMNVSCLGYTTATEIPEIFIPSSTDYKYVRFQVIGTDVAPKYIVYDNASGNVGWHKLPTDIGEYNSFLTSRGDGTMFWKKAADGLLSNNYGASVGFIGGSFATTSYASRAYEILHDRLGFICKTYAVSGAGFCQGTNFVTQANNAGVHDIYVIWCSTNDFTKGSTIGTKDDVYGTNNTCWAAYKEVLRILYSKNQRAKVCLMTSSPHLTNKKGNEEGRGSGSSTVSLKEHVEAQKEMSLFYSIPCLDQYTGSQLNGFNYSLVCRSGDFHMTALGYEMLANKQLEFLSTI